MNKLNIDDKVKIIKPGCISDGVIAKIESMQKFSDGKILYIAKYHQKCSNENKCKGYDTTVQFGEGQYKIIKHNRN